jgi:enterochelin esterase-like enzyme
MSTEAAQPAEVSRLPGGMTEFRLPDPARLYERVRLSAGLGTLDPRPDLTWADGVWSVRVALPPVTRLEYGFEVTRTITDPGNPLTLEAVSGVRSVLEMPGYQAPAWTARTVSPGTTRSMAVDVAGIAASLWTPSGLDDGDPAPLLVVQDGPAYVEEGGLTRYLSALADDGEIPATRALLLEANPRIELYGANDDYADALVLEALPDVLAKVATTAVIGVGASMGALAALHTEWRHPGSYAALLLQSGAYFTPETDPQERGMAVWPQVTAFIDEVHAEPRAADLPPVVITCGTHEENAANNLLLALRLREVGVDVRLTEIAGLHNFTAWRDTLDPALRDLVVAVAAR